MSDYFSPLVKIAFQTLCTLTWNEMSQMYSHLEWDEPYVLSPEMRWTICSLTWNEMNHVYSHLEWDEPYVLSPGMRWTICSLTWNEMNHMYSHPEWDEPYVLSPGLRWAIYSLTWNEMNHMYSHLKWDEPYVLSPGMRWTISKKSNWKDLPPFANAACTKTAVLIMTMLKSRFFKMKKIVLSLYSCLKKTCYPPKILIFW